MKAESELFPAETVAMESPRLRWMKRHDVKTKKRTDLNRDVEPWEAWTGEYDFALEETLKGVKCYPDASPFLAWGKTEDDALLHLAENNGWKLWNEEDV